MGGLFEIKPRNSKRTDTQLAQKSKKRTKPPNVNIKIKGGGSLLDRIKTIVALTQTKMSKYLDDYIIINTEEALAEYVDTCIENNIVAIDTETDRLNVLTGNVAGVCLYTPGLKGAYIPINHISYITNEKSKNQIAQDIVKTQLERIRDSEIDVDMFNAKFDIRVIKKHFGIKIKCTWDAFIAARLLNENELQNNLKALHRKYVMKGEGDAFKFDDLFKGIPFTMIPIKTGYLYAARDPHITWELCEFQRRFLNPESPECAQRDLLKVAKLFHEIEMPLIEVIAEMEDTGIDFDLELAASLSEKYHKKLDVCQEQFNSVIAMWEKEIQSFIAKNSGRCKLKYPVSITSPQQLSELLYDVIKVKSVDKKKPRGTGDDILEKIDNDVTKAIQAHRKVAKLLSTYIDKLPKEVNPDTGRIHASFWQIGADTGRMSSSDPNMQNIPAKNTDVRQMFKASDGYVLLSSDYSAQEPRITAHMSGDEMMIKAYKDGKDLYVDIASMAFNLPYDECQEFRKDGTSNKEGKDRRNRAKAIVLGVCYHKGVPAIAEDLRVSVKLAQEIYDKVMKAAPGLQMFKEECEHMARTLGYVDTIWGRKRRLPDMQLPKYEFEYAGGVPKDFDPLDDEEVEENVRVSTAEQMRYTKLLDKTWGKVEKANIKRNALEEGIKITDNSFKIAEATRQTVNSRIQGSAADQTKIAMNLVHRDVELRELGFRLLLPVHDELIGEVLEINMKAAADRLNWCMVEAAKELIVPSKCDVEATDRWFGKSIEIK